ncbi:MAG: PH domain-containing protein [Acidimicrobiaceae bacterium]|nr:PH domain-containing protein [Acidimicrobiaceae bacterium]MCO5330170.1 PH domain-containing protein [Ilumatobacteraceae bacterium]
MPDPAFREFRLEPGEDFLFAVGMRNGSLRFGPAGGALLWAALGSVIGTAIISVAFASGHAGTVTRVAAALVFTGAAVNLVKTARARVEASPHGVTVRGAYRRQRCYAWPDIVDTRVVETEPERFLSLSVSFGGARHGGGVRPDVDASKAYLVLADGSLVELPGFEAAARASGMSEGMTTPSEVKIGALRRYREAVVGPW